VLASLEHWTAGAGRNPGHDCAGLAGLAGTRGSVGFELAGQRVTLRMDGTQMAVISHDGTLLCFLPCPVPLRERHRLRGALWVPKISSTSCDQVIFVDQATNLSVFSDMVQVEIDRLW
jgi:hypothetical protein